MLARCMKRYDKGTNGQILMVWYESNLVWWQVTAIRHNRYRPYTIPSVCGMGSVPHFEDTGGQLQDGVLHPVVGIP